LKIIIIIIIVIIIIIIFNKKFWCGILRERDHLEDPGVNAG
jgi:hypothetical protein